MYECGAASVAAGAPERSSRGVAGASSRTRSRRYARRLGDVASRIDAAVSLAGGVAAAAASAGVGQSHRPQDARAGAVVVRPWRDAVVHPRGWQLAQHGRVDPARPQTPRARRAPSAQPCGDRPLVRADGAKLECPADAVCLERQTPAATTARVPGPAPPARRLRSLYAPATPSAQAKGASKMPSPTADDPLALLCADGAPPMSSMRRQTPQPLD